jgi:hypothetical protein
MKPQKPTINNVANSIKQWLTSGKLDPTILSADFLFQSPFWKQANKVEFIKEFIESDNYINTALSKIERFDPIVITVSDDGSYFNIFLTYHTTLGFSVNECVFGKVSNNEVVNLISVYDLIETKKALGL